MRKCTALVIYNTIPYYHVYELKVIDTKGCIITLATYDEIDAKHPYPYKDFKEFYTMILSWLKCNHFTPYKHHDFDTDFYNIIWIDVNHPETSAHTISHR